MVPAVVRRISNNVFTNFGLVLCTKQSARDLYKLVFPIYRTQRCDNSFSCKLLIQKSNIILKVTYSVVFLQFLTPKEKYE